MGTADVCRGREDVTFEVEVALVVAPTAVGVEVAVRFAIGVLAGKGGGEGTFGIVTRGDALGVVQIDFSVVVIVNSVATSPNFGAAKDLSLGVGLIGGRRGGRGRIGRIGRFA